MTADEIVIVMSPDTARHLLSADGMEISKSTRQILVEAVLRKGDITTLESFIPALIRDLARLEAVKPERSG